MGLLHNPICFKNLSQLYSYRRVIFEAKIPCQCYFPPARTQEIVFLLFDKIKVTFFIQSFKKENIENLKKAAELFRKNCVSTKDNEPGRTCHSRLNARNRTSWS